MGRCQVCGEKMIEQEIKQDFWIKGNLIVIEGVPAGVCHNVARKWSGLKLDRESLI